ncbi:GNAT family N-acetyltransferase [Pirellulaceae bacterium SH449]
MSHSDLHPPSHSLGAAAPPDSGPEKGYRVRRAHYDDQDEIYELLVPFFQAKKLLERSPSEILLLMATGFVAETLEQEVPACEEQATASDAKKSEIIGFASVEIYSKKLGEIQCLAVAPEFSGQQIERELVSGCVELARAKGVMEVMAISSSDHFFRDLGFDYSLPEQKRALFYEVEDLSDTESVITISETSSRETTPQAPKLKELPGYKIRRARFDEQEQIAEFLSTFFQQKKLLQRNRSEILLLMATGFVAELNASESASQSRIIGFASVEIYSEKMSEIQCLAVSDEHQGKGIGSALVQACLELAKQKEIIEVMAISSSDAFLLKLGFEYSLPEQKRALFYQLRSRADVFQRDE